MKILHITPSYKPAFVYGGPIYSVSALCEAQSNLGNDVSVFTTNANGSTNLDLSYQKLNGVSIYYFPRITGDHSHISPRLWFKILIEANKYDSIHLHSWWSILMMGCAFILKMKQTQFVVSPRGMFSDYSFSHNSNSVKKKILFGWLTKPVLRKQIFHATASSEQKEIQDLFGKDASVFTLPNLLKFPGLNPEKIVFQSENSIINLLFISRIDRKKGIEILLNALGDLNKESIKTKLTIIGEGSKEYEDELKSLSKNLGLDAFVDWKGGREWREKFDDIMAADILVLPSYNENFANIILETLYAGRPVIVSKYVGLCEYVDEERMGWVIDTKASEIVSAVKEYIVQRELWQSKSMERHKKIEADYNQNLLAEKYVVAYKKYLSK